MSRHRGAKQLHRYELLRVISLLSPAYLLFVERWPFHDGPPDHYNRLASLLDMSVLQSGKHMLLRSTADFYSSLSLPLCASVTLLGGGHPSQTTNHSLSPFSLEKEVSIRNKEEWYLKDASTIGLRQGLISSHLSCTTFSGIQ